VFAIGREYAGVKNVDPIPTGFLAVAAYFQIIPKNMMSLIVNNQEDLNAIYMGAINETAYDGDFVWVNMTTVGGTEYIGDMVGITIAGAEIPMPTPPLG
jgi:hypothetical protein